MFGCDDFDDRPWPEQDLSTVGESVKIETTGDAFAKWWKYDKWWSGMAIVKELGNTDSPIVTAKLIAAEAFKAGAESERSKKEEV